MDPLTIGAVLLAIISGAGEGLGAQLWKGALSLVRRPSHRKAAADVSATATTAMPTGETELTALQQAPTDEQRAVALAKVLLARAGADAEFRQALEAWWEQAGPIRASIGDVSNTISGGTQQGPVFQGRDFSNISFGAAPAGPPSVPPS